ncbi:MAG: AraC family transcriptional regulator [Bacteroidota bacterium]
MSYPDFNPIDFDKFVDQYMRAGTASFAFQPSDIQIYPLSIASLLIKSPTPLFRAKYNFLLIFSAGGGAQQVDNELIELHSNDVLFIREGHLNAIKSINPATDGFFIYVDSALLPQIFIDRTLLNRLTFYPKHHVSPEDMAWLRQCCELLLQQPRVNVFSQEIQISLLKSIVLRLAEASPASLSKPDRSSEITMLFKELVYEHFLQQREVKFYADTLAVSENYLHRCVNKVTSKPPKLHINEVAINYSKVLLQDPSKDITQVAFDLNFSDPSYFGRLFKQLTQQTPTQYRSSFMQDPSE